MTEFNKLLSISEDSNKIGMFLDWLFSEKGYELYEYIEAENGSYPVYRGINDLLAEYFDIDLTKLEAERMEVLRNMRDAV